MKVQYFGDVNDYRKFALLRLLAGAGGFKIGVCWMLTEDDATGHGVKREYLKRPETWRDYEPAIFDALSNVPESPALNDLRRIEAEGLIPNAKFNEVLVPDLRPERSEWPSDSVKTFEGVELAFFDPDNGLEIAARPRGRKHSNKYAFVDELTDHYRAGQSILVYQHYPRNRPRAEVTAVACDRLVMAMPNATTISLKTPFAAFILALRPEHRARVSRGLSR